MQWSSCVHIYFICGFFLSSPRFLVGQSYPLLNGAATCDYAIFCFDVRQDDSVYRERAHRFIQQYAHKRYELGYTYLHHAAWDNNVDAIRMFIAHGIDLNKKTDKGWVPLHIAALFGYIDIVRLLIHAGSDVNIQDVDDETALHIAARRGYDEIVRLLIAHGAYINMHDKYNWIPLDSAALYGFHCIAQRLIEYESDLSVRSADVNFDLDAEVVQELHAIMQVIEHARKMNTYVAEQVTSLSPQALIHQGAQSGVVFRYTNDHKRQQLLADMAYSKTLYYCLREDNVIKSVIANYEVPRTWLLYAVQMGDRDICRCLLSCDYIKRFVNRVRDHDGNRLVHVATQRNDLVIFTQLYLHHAYLSHRVYDIAYTQNNKRIGRIMRRYQFLIDLFMQAKNQYDNAAQKVRHKRIADSQFPAIGCLPPEMLQKITHYII